MIHGYRLLSPLGPETGGATVVWQAEREIDRVHVALKMLRGGVFADSPLAAPLRREAEILRELSHPNVIELLASGDGWNVFPLHGAPTWNDARRGLADIAGALAYLHARGIAHRDVKPSNVLLSTDERLILADFGLASRVDGTAIGYGTPKYLAPEAKLDPDTVDPRSDLYALGVMLAELPHLDAELIELAADLRSPSPQDRPTAADVVARLSG